MPSWSDSAWVAAGASRLILLPCWQGVDSGYTGVSPWVRGERGAMRRPFDVYRIAWLSYSCFYIM